LRHEEIQNSFHCIDYLLNKRHAVSDPNSTDNNPENSYTVQHTFQK